MDIGPWLPCKAWFIIHDSKFRSKSVAETDWRFGLSAWTLKTSVTISKGAREFEKKIWWCPVRDTFYYGSHWPITSLCRWVFCSDSWGRPISYTIWIDLPAGFVISRSVGSGMAQASSQAWSNVKYQSGIAATTMRTANIYWKSLLEMDNQDRHMYSGLLLPRRKVCWLHCV